MNNVQLVGRLSWIGEVKEYGKKDKVKVILFTVAVSKNQDEADFISVKAFGKTADLVADYFDKGDQIIVNGHIQTGSYDNEDGDTIYTMDIIADRLEFGAKKQKEQKGGRKGK